jgi:hypothetical protein
MYDYLLMFADEGSALSALSPLGYTYGDPEGGLQWDTSRVVPGVNIVLADCVMDYSDPDNPTVVSPQQLMPGFFVVVPLSEPNDGLKALSLAPETLSTVLRVEPVLLGRPYNFQGEL